MTTMWSISGEYVPKPLENPEKPPVFECSFESGSVSSFHRIRLRIGHLRELASGNGRKKCLTKNIFLSWRKLILKIVNFGYFCLYFQCTIPIVFYLRNNRKYRKFRSKSWKVGGKNIFLWIFYFLQKHIQYDVSTPNMKF